MTGIDVGVTVAARTVLPTRHGGFDVLALQVDDEPAYVLLGMGLEEATDEPLPVRLHSECLTGDALGSHRCDCGDQLDAAFAWIAAHGRGAVLYLRGHEGRGIGLVDKLRAYGLQDAGADTVDANLRLGRQPDERDYRGAARALAGLGIWRIRLLSSNPAKEEALREAGIEVVERRGLLVPERPENRAYLRTKRARMGHDPAASVDPTVGDADPFYDPARRPIVTFAQMGQSIDGFVATRAGEGLGLTSPEDHLHLHRLRSLADAVVVGASTIVSDDPRLTVRLVPGDNPVRVVLDPRARVPRQATVFGDGAAPTLWIVGPQAPVEEPPERAELVRLPLVRGRFEPAAVVAALRERGLTRVLVEGGGTTVSAFWRAGALDHLYLTISPVFLGDGVRGVQVEPSDRLDAAPRPPVVSRPLGSDTCHSFTLCPGPVEPVEPVESVESVEPVGPVTGG